MSYSISKKIIIDSLKNQAIIAAGYARVNVISPGYTLPTEGYKENYTEIISKFPFGYSSSIEDIIYTVDFLINQKSITGQHITIDAGAGLFNL